MKKYRKHSWKECFRIRIYRSTDTNYPLRNQSSIFKCHRCGVIAKAPNHFLKKIQRQEFQKYRHKLNNYLNGWMAVHVSPNSINCDITLTVKIMED